MPVYVDPRPNYPWLDKREAIDLGILGTGWINLIREMFAEIDRVLARSDARLSAHQLRMTWERELRFYYALNGATAEQQRAVEAICDSAGKRATTICLYCGSLDAKVRHGISCDLCCEEHAEMSVGER